MRIKDGSVDVRNLDSHIVKHLPVLGSVYKLFGVELVITSGNDGNHKEKSFHHKNLAIDIRTYTVSRDDLPRLIDMIKGVLGDEFDVLFEKRYDEERKITVEHLHIEYGPDYLKAFK